MKRSAKEKEWKFYIYKIYGHNPQYQKIRCFKKTFTANLTCESFLNAYMYNKVITNMS